MNGVTCTFCGSPVEPNDAFCSGCGRSLVGEAGTPSHAVPPPAGPATAPAQGTMPPIYFNLPRNPRQMASYAAGVMVIISGIFALIFGNMTLYWDGTFTDFDPDSGEEFTAIDIGPFFAGMMLLAGFGMSLVCTYCAFRLIRYELAVAGPVTLMISYFSMLAYESFMLVIGVHILILSVVSLALIYYAIPIYSGRKAGDLPLRLDVPLPPWGGAPPGGAMPPGDVGPP